MDAAWMRNHEVHNMKILALEVLHYNKLKENTKVKYLTDNATYQVI